jgi:Cu+-exporting ATPase
VTTKKLLRKGALLNGWNAVEKFGDTDAFAVNTTDLFPRGSIRVIKALAVSDMEIEEVTASAASLLMASGGALGEVFGALIRNENRLRDSVDGMFYENELGMSGFLRERRVLVGNREMMTTHRVVIAGGGLKRLDEFEAMADKLGQQMLYVAVNNRLVGVYLLEYKASASVRSALVQIISDGTNLMIYTCDANINVKLITQVFDLPPRFISILDNEGSRVYDSVTYAVTDSEEALLATNGSLKELSSAIRAAVRMKETERLGLLIQSICFVMGFLFVVILSVISPYAIDASQVLMMQAVFVIISLFSVLRAL